MGTGRAHIRIERPVDEVWAVVRDFCSVANWFPGVESCNSADGTRHVQTTAGVEVDERLVTLDDELRRQQYALVSIPQITQHLATIDVIDDSSGSLVVYSVEVEPDAMAPSMQQVYQSALAGLRDHLESQASP